MKKIVLKTLKWLFLISFFGSGWFALFNFGLSGGDTGWDLPLMNELKTEQFWESGYKGDFPKALREKGSVVVISKYGFTDIEFIGLVKLEDQDKKDFLKNHLTNVPIEKDESLWREGTLCGLGSDLSLSWQIQKRSVQDYFEFCYKVTRQNFKEVRKLELKERSEDGSTFSYMDINHIVGTNYFVVAHGGR